MPIVRLHGLIVLIALLPALLTACQPGEPLPATSSAEPVSQPPCDPDNGGIQLPDGFCALVVADNLGYARHLTVRPNGDIYVAIRNAGTDNPGGIVALRDTTGDGRADIVERFGETGGTGIALRGDYLYFAPDTVVLRFRLSENALLPEAGPELVAGGFPQQRSHASKSIAFDDAGFLYVNVGGPSNACQEQSRTAGSPGMDPCPQLERQGGIWRFQADVPGQTQTEHGQRYATGIRNAVAIAWNPVSQRLYAVQHGRDQLHGLWGDLFTAEDNAELPAEEFFLVDEGDDFGWPYCYYDHLQGAKVLAPEYGGNGREIGRCADAEDPILAFPGHWAPNDLLFYAGTQFPARYRNGAFVAFHGSWNRAPLPQAGFKVVFVPFSDALPSGDYEVFADGFAGQDTVRSTGDAQFRPTGLALGPDGSLYISDSVHGRIWRVVYTGS